VKILVVMGSPRKGETYQVVRMVEDQMKVLGEVEFDYLWLKDLNFKNCLGCHACIRFGEEKCPLRDDTALVEARMKAADGIILATPVYALNVSYLLKIVFDRFAYMWHRPRLFGKFVMGISSGGGQFKETLGYIKQNAEAWRCSYVTGLGAPHPDSLVPKRRQQLEREVEMAARKFYLTTKAGVAPQPSLMDQLWFRMWRMNAAAAKGFAPRDFKYWNEQGWFESDYYTVKRVNPAMRLLSGSIEKLMRAFMRSVYVGY
jgi:multimeric flavodoxin WrbA